MSKESLFKTTMYEEASLETSFPPKKIKMNQRVTIAIRSSPLQELLKQQKL